MSTIERRWQFLIWGRVLIRSEIQLSTIKKAVIYVHSRQSPEREATFAFGEDWGRTLSTRPKRAAIFWARTWPRNSGNERTRRYIIVVAPTRRTFSLSARRNARFSPSPSPPSSTWEIACYSRFIEISSCIYV